MTERRYKVVLVDGETFFERRRAFRGEGFAGRAKAAIDSGDGPYVSINKYGFSWECPDCGHAAGGEFGDVPVSGWDAPRWVISGHPDTPTLTPSLGCKRWREGTCIGHWWLRDGELVLID